MVEPSSTSLLSDKLPGIAVFIWSGLAVDETALSADLIAALVGNFVGRDIRTAPRARFPEAVSPDCPAVKQEVYLVVPPAFLTFFSASASASAALVGLLFVAVSLAPEQIVACQAPVERRAVAGSAFTALINACFVSLAVLIPHFNVGTPIVLFSSLSLLTSLIQAWSLLRLRKSWQSFLRRVVLILLSCGLYG